MIRKKISEPSVGANPQRKDAPVKPTTESNSSRFRPNALASHPVIGRIIALATRYDVTVHVASSIVAERLPAMCGSDTLTTLVSSTSMKVASITEMAMIHGLMFGCSSAMASKPSALVSPSPYLSRKDRWFSGESRPQQPLGILIGIQHDLDRHALHHLDEVPSRVFRRQQREPGAGGAGDAVDFAGEFLAADRVDLHGRPLARTHVLQLRLLEVRDDPHLVQRHDRHQRLARLD